VKALPLLTLSALAFGAAACDAPTPDPSEADPGFSPDGPVFDGGIDPTLQPPPFGGTFGGVAPGFGGLTGGLSGLFPPGAGGRPVRLSELRTAATPPPAISGGSLAVSEDGRQLVAADPDRDAVYVVDVQALRVQTVSLPQGSEPGRVAFDRSGGAHVALRGSGKVLRVDLASGGISTQTAICTQPRGVAFDAKNNTMVASCIDGQVVTLDAATHREVGRQTLSPDLRDVLVSAAGARRITRYRSAELLSLEGDTVKATARPRDAQGFGTLAIVLPGPVSADGGVASPGRPGTTSLSPTLAWRALPSQRGGAWMLHQQSQNGEIVIGKGGYGSGCQTITNGAVTEFDAAGQPARTMPVNLSGLSVDLAVSPDEKWLALASPGGFARSMASIQLYAATGLQPEQFPGSCPTVAASGGTENQTVAVAFDGAGVLYALSREPAELQIYDIQAVTPPAGLPTGIPSVFSNSAVLMRRATLALSLRSARDTGHDLFHADVGQGLACASCHGEALDDGHVWTFQKIGPRRTQNMRGGFLSTAPFHWDGDMASISHLVDDVMTVRMGGFPVEAQFATALGKWIDLQPAIKLPASDAAAAARGKTLFESSETGCASCHTGANLTNNESRDVGTGGRFQVPGLLGLSLRAPFMHNGCAKTLEERFSEACGGGDAHGKTSQLSSAQRADMVAYLKSL
jgi:DNA-binding beta-propeller fold protein YncE/mono/diheme cytochrome c family protein